MNNMYVPIDHPTLVPARMGWMQLGVILHCPSMLGRDTGQEGHSSLVVAETLAIWIIEDS